MSMANFKIDGKPVSMVFETRNISHGETALVVGGGGPFLAIKGTDKSSNEIVSRKKAVYFEQNRKGKWIIVAVPVGMTKQQLMKLEKFLS